MSMYGYGATVEADVGRVRQNWGWFLALGVGLGILGIIALGATVTTTVVSTVILGVVVLIGGLVVIASVFTAGGGVGGAILRGALGVLLLLAGVYLIFNPQIGALTLTLVMAWYFIIAGAVKVVSSLIERYPGWGWTLTAGVVTFLLGLLLTASWPVSGLYAIGLFVGIDLILAGVTWIVVALMARSAVPQPHGATPAV